MCTFDLLREQWIPVLTLDGTPREVGIRDALSSAAEWKGIADPSPVVTYALHRPLLAILYRCFGEITRMSWPTLYKSGWDAKRLDAYLGKTSCLFDLFDAERPFYQVSALHYEYEKPATKLAFEIASGDNATLFDHTSEENAPALTPGEAARLIVAYQVFAVGGLVTFEKGQDRKLYGSADSGPAAKAAVVLVAGQNLFDTLMLNLHHYSPEDEEPFAFDGDREDLPAWERTEETRAEDRRPTGYVDLLTWQSRRIRLHPVTDSQGRTVVRHAVVMKGNQFPDGYLLHEKEPAVAFIKREKPTGKQPPWAPLAFREGKALWRDSLALLESVAERQDRPKIIDWLCDLTADGALPPRGCLELSVLGLASDQAKIEWWRHERLPLPSEYLKPESAQLLGELAKCLQLAEDARKGLWFATFSAIQVFLQTEDDAKALLQSLAPERPYWAALETPFHKLLVDLTANGDEARQQWARAVKSAAEDSFTRATQALGPSARAIKAVAKAEPIFHGRVNRLVAEFLGKKEVAHA